MPTGTAGVTGSGTPASEPGQEIADQPDGIPTQSPTPPGGGDPGDGVGGGEDAEEATTPTPVPVPVPTPSGADESSGGDGEPPAPVDDAETAPEGDAADQGAATGTEEMTGPTSSPSPSATGFDVEAEIEATVQALREEALADPGSAGKPEAQKDDEGSGSPQDGSGAAGVDYVLYAAGLMVLLVAAGRRRMHG